MAPRYSIVAGDFAEDSRADILHFRVYLLIGRHTNKHGWCRLKQVNIAQALGISRKTVNLRIKDLVDWGYVEKRSHDATGRSIFYRTKMDRGDIPEASGDESDDDENENQAAESGEDMQPENSSGDGPVNDGLHVGCNSKVTPAVTDKGVTAGVTDKGVTPERPSLTTFSNDSPPNPPRGGGRGRGVKVDEVDVALRALRDQRPADEAWRIAVDGVLRPVVTTRRLDAASFDNAARILAVWICDKRLSGDEAERVVASICAARRATVKPSDIEDAVKAVLGLRPQRAVLAGDANLMDRWPQFLDDLRKRVGREKVDAWFSTVVIATIIGDRADLVTHLPIVSRFIEMDFSAQVRASLADVYGVSAFTISARKVAA